MKTSKNIQEQFKFFVETLPDGDYEVESSSRGAYDMRRDPTFITVRGGTVIHLYQDIFCGMNAIEGGCYRPHRDGRRIAQYPKRLDRAVDISEQWADIAGDWPACIPADGWE